MNNFYSTGIINPRARPFVPSTEEPGPVTSTTSPILHGSRWSSLNNYGQSPGRQTPNVAKGDVKYLTCWFWKNNGHCRKPDHVCPYSHSDTGLYASKPEKVDGDGQHLAGNNLQRELARRMQLNGDQHQGGQAQARHLQQPVHHGNNENGNIGSFSPPINRHPFFLSTPGSQFELPHRSNSIPQNISYSDSIPGLQSPHTSQAHVRATQLAAFQSASPHPNHARRLTIGAGRSMAPHATYSDVDMEGSSPSSGSSLGPPSSPPEPLITSRPRQTPTMGDMHYVAPLSSDFFDRYRYGSYHSNASRAATNEATVAILEAGVDEGIRRMCEIMEHLLNSLAPSGELNQTSATAVCRIISKCADMLHHQQVEAMRQLQRDLEISRGPSLD